MGELHKVEGQGQNESIVERMYRADLPDSRDFPPGRLAAHRDRLLGENQAHRRLFLGLALALGLPQIARLAQKHRDSRRLGPRDGFTSPTQNGGKL